MPHTAVIVGAGPAGLALAIGFAKAGLAVTVIERLFSCSIYILQHKYCE